MTDEVHALELQRVKELLYRIDQELEIARPDVLRGAAVTGQLERVDDVVGRQGGSNEQPVVEIATEPVQKHDRLAGVPLSEVAQRSCGHPHGLSCGTGVLL